jgi:hypothetical protein
VPGSASKRQAFAQLGVAAELERSAARNDMDTFNVEEIHSGLDNDCLWVSIGFISDDPLDVLHIVCPTVITEQDRQTDTADIYVERRDQSEGCYAGISELFVSKEHIDIQFSEKGQQGLGLPSSVRFVIPETLNGLTDAIKTFAQMSALEPGRCIKIPK